MGKILAWVVVLPFLMLIEPGVPTDLTSFDICNEAQVTNSGIIVTPNKIQNNSAYAPNLDCEVSVFAGTTDTASVKLHFRSFDTDWDEGDTCYDPLVINGKEYCGVYTGLDLCFVTNSLDLTFESDNFAESNDLHSGFEIEFMTSEDNQCECLTESGEGETVQTCVFPFIYQGVTYHQCAGDVRLGEKPFCAVQVNDTGFLTDDANRKFCNMTLEACEQKCLSTTGDQCLLPYQHEENEMTINTCSVKLLSETTLTCPIQRGKTNTSTINVEYRDCQMDSCRALDTCSSTSTDTSGQLVSLDTPYIFGTNFAYNTDTTCYFNYYSATNTNYYLFTFEKLDIHCEDALQIGDASGAFVYNLCSRDSDPDYSNFEICLPTRNVSLLFQTGTTNSETFQRSGFFAKYSQITEASCHIAIEDDACSLPEGAVVTEGDILHSKFYPLPYPANSQCLWKIVTPSSDLAVNVSVADLDLGLWQDPFLVTDSIHVSDPAGRFLEYLPGPSSGSYDSFLSIPGNTTVYFQSGALFNYHGTFRLEVSFFNFTTNLQMYVDEGFCVSRETPDVCQIPFTYEGKEYRVCDYLEPSDEQPSCLSYRNEKVACDADIVACGRQFPDFTGYDVTYDVIDENTTRVNVSWTVRNDFWDYFQVYAYGEPYLDFRREFSISGNITANYTDLRLRITVVGFIDQPKYLHLTLYPGNQIQTSSLDDFSTVKFSWPAGEYDELEYSLSKISNLPFDAFAEKLGLKDLGESIIFQGRTEYTFNDLLPGVPYNFSFSGNSHDSVSFAIAPNPLANFSINQYSSNNIKLSGNLTRDTICLSIYFIIRTENSTSGSSRRRRSDDEILVECSFDSGCIDAEGILTLDLSALMSQPETCYNVTARSSTNGVNSELSETITFCTAALVVEDIVPPMPIYYWSSSPNSPTRGLLGFHVDESVMGFDYVSLHYYDATTNSFSNDGFVCYANGTFQGGSSHECEIPGLAPNDRYNITLRGHDPDRENEASGGLSGMSQNFTILHETPFTMDCYSDSFGFSFYLAWVQTPPSSSSFRSTTIQSSESGTDFNEQIFIQNTWPDGNVFIPPESVPLFRGLPSAITIQNDSEAITHLFSRYNFTDGKYQINGDSAFFEEDLSETLNMQPVDARITSVSGSIWSSGYLTAIQFGMLLESGENEASPCFGVGSCSEFQFNQQNPNEFLVGFAGKMDEATGHIVELTLNWITIADVEYFLGTENCPVNGGIDWYDYEQSYLYYNVENLNVCETSRRVIEENQNVVYENRIAMRHALSNSQDGENQNTEDLGQGNMTASRSWSSGGVVIQCVYEANGVVSARFDTTPNEDPRHVSQTNAVQFEMLLYPDESFADPRNWDDGVLTVSSGDTIYFAVSFADFNNYNMTLYAHTCYAKKTDNPQMAEDGSNYLLLESEGCPSGDDTFKRYSLVRSDADDKMDPMSIQAFHWFDDDSSLVHLHCKVRACVSENEEHCQAPAQCSRARRDVTLHDSEVESFVSSQPIRIQQTRNMLVQPMEKGLMVNWIWIPLSMVCGVLFAFVIITANKLWKRRNTYGRYHRVPQSN